MNTCTNTLLSKKKGSEKHMSLDPKKETGILCPRCQRALLLREVRIVSGKVFYMSTVYCPICDREGISYIN
jgi:ssDNA-binding Zn-finger/Zn-ribbon topoisomerase 1